MVTQSAAAGATPREHGVPANGNAGGARRRSSSRTGVSPRCSTRCSPSRASTRCSTASRSRSRDLMPYEALHIYEADEDRRVLVPLLARSQVYEEEIMRSRPRFGEGSPAGRSRTARRCGRTAPHLDPRAVTVPGTPGRARGDDLVPLIARGALKGALNIYRIGEDAEFAEHEFHLARSFGDAAALALDNAQIRARLEHLAQTDSLTGLYNHRYFHERLRVGADARVALARHRRRADVRPRRLQARQRRLRPRRRRPAADPGGARRARHRSRLRRRLPHRRRGVRRDHAVVRRRRRARARLASQRAPARRRHRPGRRDHRLDGRRAGAASMR